LFAFLYWRSDRPHAPGQIIGLYLVISSIVRFFIEFERFHEQALPFGLPLSITQWLAIGLAIAGAVLLVPPGRMMKKSPA
jgi:prolipoprotein diacylglyceryltransferase